MAKRESDPEIEIIPPLERIKLIRQREHLILLLVKMGFKQLSTNPAAKPLECILLLKDGAQGNEQSGVRISIPQENNHIQIALLGNDADENAAIIFAINAGGCFSATKDTQEQGVIGDYYNVTMIREPEVTSTKIKYMSLGTTNRIWALIKRVIMR